jgi:hypothetical protein
MNYNSKPYTELTVMAGDFKVRVGNNPVKNITEIKEEND